MTGSKSTIEEECNKINLWIFAAVIFSCVVASLFTYWTYKDDRENFFFRETSRISNSLEDSFTSVNHYLKFVGKSIVDNCERNNLEKIASFLQDKVPDDIIEKEVIAMTMFDWIQPDRMYVANSIYGVFPKKVNIEHRSYLDKTDKFPWKAFHSAPIIGVPSAQKVIPVGMGVMDEYGEFYGTISTGIRIEKLEEKVEAGITGDGITFILLDQEYNPIIASKHFYKSNKRKANLNEFLSEIKTKIGSNEDSEGFFAQQVSLGGDIQYKYFKKISSYPYFLIIGEVASIDRNSLIARLIPILMAITFIGLCAVIIQVMFKIKVIRPVIALNKLSKESINTTIGVGNFSSTIIEIDEIAAKINNLSEILNGEKQRLDEVEHIKSVLEEKVSERTANLENALKVKTEFLNNISHEVRTPVQGVTAITKGLVDHWNEFDDNKKFKLVKDVFKSSDRLFYLINNLLDISKFASGKMQFHFEKADIRRIVKQVTEEFKLYIDDNKNLKLSVTVQKDCNVDCLVDPSRITQVLRNLLSNAIKFTKSGSVEILIDNYLPKGRDKNISYIRVGVKDSGVGVPVDELEHIFESFEQSSRTKTLAIGTGLGLSISKEIIAGHDCKIWAENNIDQKGTVFYFTLPGSAKIESKEKIIDKSRIINILLIDDEDLNHTSLTLLLYGLNFNITAINTGHGALDYLNKHKQNVDLILLDLIMPDIYGIDILKYIKKDKSLANIPVILQSGLAGDSDITEAMKLGAVAHIEKPFNRTSLLDKINAIFG